MMLSAPDTPPIRIRISASLGPGEGREGSASHSKIEGGPNLGTLQRPGCDGLGEVFNDMADRCFKGAI
jgi:hypothetical protein